MYFDQTDDVIYGYKEDGTKWTMDLSSSSLAVMAVGIIRRWKYPLGYFLTDTVMKGPEIQQVVNSSISAMEKEGFSCSWHYYWPG